MPGWQHAVGEPRGVQIAVSKGRDAEGRFGVLFKGLKGFEPPDGLLADLAGSMRDPGAPEDDNPLVPSGFTFLGQFLDHDFTRDETGLSAQAQDPLALTNFRTPRFDLDSVYGRGPVAQPELYNAVDPVKLQVENVSDPTKPDDLPRRADGKAVIGDGRNDENLIICQLHVAFLKFHNAMVNLVRARGTPSDQVFEEARRVTRWHYQWMVVHDFLPRIVGRETVNQLLREQEGKPPKIKLDFYKPKKRGVPFMPIEFSVAAYRFGHSQVRGGYRLNDRPDGGGPIFGSPAIDLRGFRPIPPRFEIKFEKFFEIPGGPPPTNITRKIDSKLAAGLFTLPTPEVVSSPPDPPPPPPLVLSLAERNLRRGKKLGLPAGQDVAQEMQKKLPGIEVLSNAELGLSNDRGWGGKAPLWFYVLKEADLQGNGERLGDVGGRIVAEVFLGMLDHDETSYLHAEEPFVPEAPIAPARGQFGIGDLLRAAGVA